MMRDAACRSLVDGGLALLDFWGGLRGALV
jgi:hypothetical protein